MQLIFSCKEMLNDYGAGEEMGVKKGADTIAGTGYFFKLCMDAGASGLCVPTPERGNDNKYLLLNNLIPQLPL
jgi:hypothetical protein